jgi:hypothetical protein
MMEATIMKILNPKLLVAIGWLSLILGQAPLANAYLDLSLEQNLSNTLSLDEGAPSMAGTVVVYSSSGFYVPAEIRLYDTWSKQMSVVVKNGFSNNMPSMSGDLIAYQSNRPTYGVYVCRYNSLTKTCPEVNVTNGMFRTNYPYVKGNHVMWAEKKSVSDPFVWKYCYFDKNLNACTNYKTIATGLYDNSRIVMLDDQDTVLWTGSNMIYGAKLSQPGVVKAIFSGKGLGQSYYELAESKGKLVFRYSDSDVNRSSIMTCDMDTLNMVCLNQKTIVTVPYVPTAMNPTISGNYVAYQYATSADTLPQLQIYDFKSDEYNSIIPDKNDYMRAPVVGSNYIVFTEGGDSFLQTEICGFAFSERIEYMLNGNFEAGKTSWRDWSTTKALTTEAYFDGASSAKLTLTTGDERKINQLVENIKPLANFEFSAAIKTQIVESTPQASIEVQWRKASGAEIRVDTFGFTGGTSTWAVKKVLLKAPADADSAKVSLIGPAGSGAVYFDAVSMKRIYP